MAALRWTDACGTSCRLITRSSFLLVDSAQQTRKSATGAPLVPCGTGPPVAPALSQAYM